MRAKSLQTQVGGMYRRRETGQLSIEAFILPFGGKLSSDNRWVKLAQRVPWGLVEQCYAEQMDARQGARALSARVAFGALIIKERLNVSDEEAVEQIRENPYLQYFLGYEGYRDAQPFDPSMYVHFRKRFSMAQLSRINEAIVKGAIEATQQEASSDAQVDTSSDAAPPTDKPTHQGKLVMDATCAPVDIRYPTDISLLNEAREKTEKVIDVLFEPRKGCDIKPRTYRNNARRDYLRYTKKRKHTKQATRRAIGQQLRYVQRNLATIETLLEKEGISLTLLSKKRYRDLVVIHELYRQQTQMHASKTHRIDNRIVSISQPHVRPIVRGKTRTPVEFGPKLSASLVDGYSFVDRLEWDAYHEARDLQIHIEAYQRRFGFLPESVHCDALYRTRKNRMLCKSLGIRISGKPLGRPAKVTHENSDHLQHLKTQQRQDEVARIAIEGAFGRGKRRFGLGHIMAKLAHTCESAIAIIFIVMNLEKALACLFAALSSPLRCALRAQATRTSLLLRCARLMRALCTA